MSQHSSIHQILTNVKLQVKLRNIKHIDPSRRNKTPNPKRELHYV